MSGRRPPERCDVCGGRVVLADTGQVYGPAYAGKGQGYLCMSLACRAYVGCHPGTDVPLGTMADRETRQARRRAHAAFDPLWRRTPGMRRRAYAWLADQLGLAREECHIGLFDKDTCERVISLCRGLAR
ncbi:MAG TPA: zinc-finger-containing protein [Gammaproteobacteria bacterium]|nr:zinc-finger-containing protein [Gammaproteobacteria bacterium]